MDQLTFEYTRRDGAKSRSEVAAARSSLTPGVKLACGIFSLNSELFTSFLLETHANITKLFSPLTFPKVAHTLAIRLLP